jgi:hypothetical protein
VRNFIFEPGVTGHNRDAEDLRLRRLNQQQHRLLIRSCRAGGVLIDDEFSLGGSVFGPAQSRAKDEKDWQGAAERSEKRAQKF